MKKITINWPEFNWQGGRQLLSDFIKQVEGRVNEAVRRIVEAELNADVEQMLGRAPYEREITGTARVSMGQCPRCGGQYRADMVRNGYRTRHLLTAAWGELVVDVPRVRCRCGGSVPVAYHLCQPYQRFFGDWGDTIRQLATDGLSLRQIQADLSERLGSSVGLRTINVELHAIEQRLSPVLASVAPVLLLDAIWMKVLTPTGETHFDTRGRQRAVKHKHKVAVLIALAVWPESGHSQVLDWELADSEDAAAWQTLLERLDGRGVYRERGLSLIIHDGGKGLEAALERVYPHIPHQRCVFHKLRNVWQAIVIDDTLSREQAFALRLKIARQAAAVFRAPDQQTALERLDAFRDQFAATQPAAVATLERDLDATLAFYAILERFPRWKATALRTTSPLERVNRRLRRIFRLVGAFHSLLGLNAAIARILAPFFAS